ncbi:MAG: polyprenyl synthetase family protein [Sneathiellaceae bacterium]
MAEVSRTFLPALEALAAEVEARLEQVLPQPDGPEHRLLEAMRYAVLGGGKRLRPFLTVATADMFGVPRQRSLQAAAAVELLHSYSLVHDDLPAMDDDALRRGRPTVHMAFDEATAILTGDALLTLAFETLADPVLHPEGRVRVEVMQALAQAGGPQGMVAGQAIDLAISHHDADLAAITRLQQMKTGALIGFCCTAAALLGAAKEDERLALRAYTHDLGLAFQITDDVLDVTGDAARIGKSPGKDEAAGKATFVALLGLDQARRQAAMLADQAGQHLEIFGQRAKLLRDLAAFAVHREF